jgi:hypothetical protein
VRGKGLGVRGIGNAVAQYLFFAVCTIGLSHAVVSAQTPLSPPQDVRAIDTPSDGGGSLTVLWSPAPSDSAETTYQILLSEGTTVPDPAAMKVVAEFPANQRYVRESKWPWWTRPAAGDQHQVTLRNGKGIELKDGTAYLVESPRRFKRRRNRIGSTGIR